MIEWLGSTAFSLCRNYECWSISWLGALLMLLTLIVYGAWSWVDDRKIKHIIEELNYQRGIQ